MFIVLDFTKKTHTRTQTTKSFHIHIGELILVVRDGTMTMGYCCCCSFFMIGTAAAATTAMPSIDWSELPFFPISKLCRMPFHCDYILWKWQKPLKSSDLMRANWIFQFLVHIHIHSVSQWYFSFDWPSPLHAYAYTHTQSRLFTFQNFDILRKVCSQFTIQMDELRFMIFCLLYLSKFVFFSLLVSLCHFNRFDIESVNWSL